MSIICNAEEPAEPAEQPEEPAKPAEPIVVKYKNLLSTKISFGYNFIFFNETAHEDSYQTNRPLSIGMGIGIKNISLGFSFSVPVLYDPNYRKSPSFDVGFNHYFKDKSYTYGFVKYYDGFYNPDPDIGNIDLQILTMGISQEFLLNRNHSLRSVYNLDERQTKSNGTFLLGGGLFFTAIQSDTLDNYNKNQRTFHFGPNFGYSYIWVFKSNFFINVLSTFGLDLLINNKKVSAGLQVLPRFSVGYHGKTWSANFYVNYPLLIGGFRTEKEYYLLPGNIGLSAIKRFL
jgi:hypothetical protein